MKGASPPSSPGGSSLPLPKPKRRRLWTALIIAGAGLLLVVILLLMFGPHRAAPSSKVEAAIRSAMQEQLSQTKEERFNKILFAMPGSAVKEDVVQNVTIQWKTAQPTDSLQDVQGCTVDHTLSWKSLLHDNGYTKISDTYDFSTGTPRLTNTQIIDSNGLTRKGLRDATVTLAIRTIEEKINKSQSGSPTPTP